MKKKYILVIAAIILCLIFSLTGCGKKTYQAGEFSHRNLFREGPRIGIKADTDTFAKDNVTFDLYCGIYNADIHNSGKKSNPRSQYNAWGEYELVFAIYARKQGANEPFGTVDDYKNISGYYLIKEMSEKEAFSEKYEYTSYPEDGVIYNSIESITIPETVFFSQNDRFEIRLMVFMKDQENNTYIIVDDVASITLKYEFLSKDEIKIHYKFNIYE